MSSVSHEYLFSLEFYLPNKVSWGRESYHCFSHDICRGFEKPWGSKTVIVNVGITHWQMAGSRANVSHTRYFCFQYLADKIIVSGSILCNLLLKNRILFNAHYALEERILLSNNKFSQSQQSKPSSAVHVCREGWRKGSQSPMTLRDTEQFLCPYSHKVPA